MRQNEYRQMKCYSLSPQTIWIIEQKATGDNIYNSRALDTIAREWADKESYNFGDVTDRLVNHLTVQDKVRLIERLSANVAASFDRVGVRRQK